MDDQYSVRTSYQLFRSCRDKPAATSETQREFSVTVTVRYTALIVFAM